MQGGEMWDSAGGSLATFPARFLLYPEMQESLSSCQERVPLSDISFLLAPARCGCSSRCAETRTLLLVLLYQPRPSR